MPRLLVSVRSVREALSAAQAGAHFIDLKEPARSEERRVGKECA